MTCSFNQNKIYQNDKKLNIEKRCLSIRKKLNSWSVFYAFIYQILIIVICDENSKCDEIK